MLIQVKRVLRFTKRLSSNTRRLTLAVLGMALLLWLILVVPGWIVPTHSDASLRDVSDAAKRYELQDARLTLQNNVRTTLIQALGGVVVLLGAWTAWRQYLISREGHVAERFTHAIDQLGNDQLDVTLGGIYALDRVARDSPSDRAAIATILAVYIRGHAPWPPQPDKPAESEPLDCIQPLKKRAPDVQAALTVLSHGHLSKYNGSTQNRSGLDLSHTDLRKADLAFAHLDEADLQGAHLEGAELCQACMRGVYLNDAHLEGAQLRDAVLGSADLRNAHLEGADLGFVDLRPSHRIDRLHLAADLNGVHLEGADLYNTLFEGADLDGADFSKARNINDAHFVNAGATAATRWPDAFDWRAAGVKLINKDQHET